MKPFEQVCARVTYPMHPTHATTCPCHHGHVLLCRHEVRAIGRVRLRFEDVFERDGRTAGSPHSILAMQSDVAGVPPGLVHRSAVHWFQTKGRSSPYSWSVWCNKRRPTSDGIGGEEGSECDGDAGSSGGDAGGNDGDAGGSGGGETGWMAR